MKKYTVWMDVTLHVPIEDVEASNKKQAETRAKSYFFNDERTYINGYAYVDKVKAVETIKQEE